MSRILVVFLLAAAAAAAQHSENPPPSCADLPLYTALDFWLGNWNVYSGDDLAGTNRIEKILGGCAIMEHWTGAGDGEGKSLFYVDDSGTWQQVWVTQWSTMPGGVKEKRWQPLARSDQVRFQGTITRADGSQYLDRTTLTRLDNGDVRQLIEISGDGGDSWEATFDAVYKRGGQ